MRNKSVKGACLRSPCFPSFRQIGIVNSRTRFLPMKTLSGFCAALLLFLPVYSSAQVNSGSNGSDGALNPTANLVIDMADHPDGIYHYTSVNIPAGVTVSFIPNAGNKPVVWLVQGDCVISGTVDVAGKNETNGVGGNGGPGGYRGGNGGTSATSGQGPGGGARVETYVGNSGSYATLGTNDNGQTAGAGPVYGNKFVLPLQGGSGGGGVAEGPAGGGGGGGSLLIASSATISLSGGVYATGGAGNFPAQGGGYGGHGSGGSVRLIANIITGAGVINATGGRPTGWELGSGGLGRIRFDVSENNFGGSITGNFTQGFQPIIIPAAGQGFQLSIASIAGNAVSPNPSGVLVNPDVIIPAQQVNPISIVVNCNNIPLNSEISVIVHPANAPDVQAVATNNAGTLAASTATVSLNMPRGGGIIYAKCVSGLAGLGADNSSKELRTKSLAETGWTTDGERFAKVEVTASLGGQQQIAYITESGKRYSLAAR